MDSTNYHSLTSQDHATIYEDWLLRYRKIVESDDNEVDVIQALTVRAGRLGALQSADKEEPFVQELLEQVQLEMDQDVQHEMKHWDKMVLQWKNNDKERLPLHEVSVDVDAFFEEYPECIRADWNDEDSSDEEEEIDDKKETMRRRKKPNEKHPQPPTSTFSEQKMPPQRSATAPNGNPYAMNSHQTRPKDPPPQQPPPSQQQTGAFQYTPVDLTGPDHSQPAPRAPPPVQYAPPSAPPAVVVQQSSWDDHRNRNPFQTAREYAWAGGNKDNNQLPQQQQGACNPYARAASLESPPPEQPVIRESLKRKFQPPKRVASSETNATKNQGKGGRPPTSKAVASAKGGVTHRNDATNENNSEEDDLPEELKRFGKELVEKIENEIMDCGEPITFDDIAGLADAKQTIQEVICWPMKRPDLFTGLRRAPNGLLLYGPPGTGKTLIGKAIAYESGATFFSISSSSLTSKWIGEGEKLVRTLFAVAAYKEPAVVFIDEIDSLLTQRKADENEASRRIKTEFLVQLDGTGTSGQGRVLVIGATNRPQELDEAARRRFVKRLYIPLPEEHDREILLRVLLDTNNHRLVEAEIKKLSRDTAGFSGADLKALCTDAAMGPIRQLGAKALEVEVNDVPPISYKHFLQSLRGMKPSVAPSDLVQYEEWDKVYGSKRAEIEMDEDDDSVDDL